MNKTYNKMKNPQMATKLTILHEVRCPNSHRFLGNLNGIYEIRCKKCKQVLEGRTG